MLIASSQIVNQSRTMFLSRSCGHILCYWMIRILLCYVLLTIASESLLVTAFSFLSSSSSIKDKNPILFVPMGLMLNDQSDLLSYPKQGSPMHGKRLYKQWNAFIKVTPSTSTTCLFDGIGNNDNQQPPGGGKSNDNPWSHFLNPNYKESDNLQKAREFASENSLPISYNNDINPSSSKETNEDSSDASSSSPSSSMILSNSNDEDAQASQPDGKVLLTADQLAKNPYISIVSKLTPSEMISKFTSSAHPRVQNAVRTTILGMIGGFPQLGFETSAVTSGQTLASLMFQLQMTGYMFKNAEYRLSLQQSLGMSELTDLSDQFLLSNGFDHLDGKVGGKIRVKYSSRVEEDEDEDGSASDDSAVVDIEVDADAYLTELRTEVKKLRDEFAIVRKEEEDKISKQDLLTFIRTLPPQELQTLTNTMSQDVLIAMKGLVHAVLTGIVNNQNDISYDYSKVKSSQNQQQQTVVGPETLIEQSTEALAQLCMWQLVTGYNLRTLEVREEMMQSLLKSDSSTLNNDDNDESIGILQ